jgi:3-hydroxyacyl-CoA dehydrogenase/enoyl-CoA hydratase/3-hydroxybutyryl-CoA epimerase
VPGRLTTERTVLGARVAALALGKTPIVVRDSPGFLVNRLLMSYLNECLLLPLEGLDYREVDAMAVRFGMPMGPFALLDEIGLDVAREVARSLHEAYGGRMGRDGLFDALKGRPDLLGRKSGKGFYLYRGVGKRTANPEMRGIVSSLRDGARGRDAMSAFDALHRSLMAMVNEAARALEEGVVDSAERLDLALVLGIGFPPFRGGLLRYADELGAGNVLESLLRYERRFGERFAPAPLIEKLAKGKSGFYAAR